MKKGHCCEMLYNQSLPASKSEEDDLIFLVSTPIKQKIRKVSAVPLPLFVSIIETGKLRLVEFLSFLDFHLKKDAWRYCYSHVDNCVFVFGSDDISDCVLPVRKKSFESNIGLFFDDEKPGGFKIELRFDSTTDWKFCSHSPQNHIALSNGTGYVKSAAFKELDLQTAFDNAVKFLNREKVSVPVTRRVNKLAGLETEPQILHYFNKK
jgi:hypothetical protein